MKKLLSIFLTVSMLMTLLTVTGCAASNDNKSESSKSELSIVLQIDNSTMKVNGEEKPIDESGTTPVIVNDRTLVPIRAIIENMGGTVGWEADTRAVTLDYEKDEIKLTIDSTTAYLNGEAAELDTAPAIINDRTMLPIRFIAESFKFDVAWDGASKTITIVKAASDVPEPATEPDAETGSKTLVAYFSATGNTKTLAEKVAKAADADIFEIVPSEPYTSADLDYNSDCRANREQQDDTARPGIANEIENYSDYDTIIICHPIWWGTIPRIIYTFMDTYDLSGKTVYTFCTSGSSGISTALSDVKSYASGADVVNGMRGTNSTTVEDLSKWLTSNGYKK